MQDIEEAMVQATANIKKLQIMIPSDLQNRENGLVEIFAKHKGKVLCKLHDLYEFMELLYSYVSPITPCKKGCSYCCHIPISVSPLELEYMKNRNRKLQSMIGPYEFDTSSACPFLSKGACSIYNIRPFFCRRHVVFTNSSYWCHPERCHAIKLPLLNFSEIDKVYTTLLVESGTMNSFFDIREIGYKLAK